MRYDEESDRDWDDDNIVECKTYKIKSHIFQDLGYVLDGKETCPRIFHYCAGFPNPKFRITVEPVDEDFVIDSNGTKWVKDKTHEKEKV